MCSALKCLQVIKIDPSNDNAKRRLAEIYEANGQLRRALDLLMSSEMPFSSNDEALSELSYSYRLAQTPR